MHELNYRGLRWLLTPIACLLFAITLAGCASSPKPQSDASKIVADNAELASIYKADQADRQGVIDWHAMSERDQTRETRVREMLSAGLIQSPKDYYHAAMVFQHTSEGDGLRLAHELSMIGAALGDKNCRWLAAASYDRLLNRLGQEQRFGTQYVGVAGAAPTLSPVSPGVSDAMRAALNVPTLQQAKDREKKIQEDWKKSNPEIK